jgi:hypothetical protein
MLRTKRISFACTNLPYFNNYNKHFYSSFSDVNGFIDLNKKSNWHTYTSMKHYDVISSDVLKLQLYFFIELFKRTFKEKNLQIMFKIKFDNGDLRSCSTIQVTTLNEKDLQSLFTALSSIFRQTQIYEFISQDNTIDFFDLSSGLPRGNIIFYFKPLKDIKFTKFENVKNPDIQNTFNLINSDKDPLLRFKYNGFTIPSSMDLSLWPNIMFINNYHSSITSTWLSSGSSKFEYKFISNIKDFSIDTTVLINNELSFTFTDYSLNNNKDLSSFKRVIFENGKEYTYIFSSGKLVLFKENIKTKFMQKIPKNIIYNVNSKILTLDIETIGVKILPTNKSDKIDVAFVPTVMTIYNGIKPNSFIFDKSNWEQQLILALKKYMTRKYDGYTIYTHNFSHFDSIFILNALSILGEVKPFMRNGKILRLVFKFKPDVEDSKRVYTLYFMDSLLMLPASLDKLSKSFNIRNKKYTFPHLFLNEDNIDLNYVGKCPPYKFFPNAYTDEFTLLDYKNYIKEYENKDWVLLDVLVKYCENDTKALFQIIINFRLNIYKKFKIDIVKYPTIASLTFAIFRSNFLIENLIPIIKSKLHKIIKLSYYGGITELYQSFGRNLNSYDVNSLYPFAMKNFEMPVGEPIYVKGNLKHIIDFLGLTPKQKEGESTLNREIPFGFFKVKVTAPDILDKPFLPKRHNTKFGMRTIFPLGKWSGWYFSKEIENAMRHGYKFEFIEGYIFEKANIFSEYIDVLYDIKMNVSKDDPWYYISKLLMNSLYGRFGLNPEGEEVQILNPAEADEIIQTKKQVNIIPLLSGNVMVSYEKAIDEFDMMVISVPISSAIAAYSRIKMSHYLIKYSSNLYYVDTDGIKIKGQLDNDEVDGKKLGFMEFEYNIEEFVGLGPKAYGCIISKDNKTKKIVKLKGYGSTIEFDKFKEALNINNKIELNQKKWNRKLSLSTIILTDEPYTLSITEGKRNLIYNHWGDLVCTTPLVVENENIIKNERLPAHLMYLKNPYLFKS